MDDDVKQILMTVFRLLVGQDEDILRLRAELGALKLWVIESDARAPDDVRSALSAREADLLDASRHISERQKELRSVIQLFEQHGDDVGKHRA